MLSQIKADLDEDAEQHYDLYVDQRVPLTRELTSVISWEDPHTMAPYAPKCNSCINLPYLLITSCLSPLAVYPSSLLLFGYKQIILSDIFFLQVNWLCSHVLELSTSQNSNNPPENVCPLGNSYRNEVRGAKLYIFSSSVFHLVLARWKNSCCSDIWSTENSSRRKQKAVAAFPRGCHKQLSCQL